MTVPETRAREDAIRRLWRERPRNRFLEISVVIMLVLVVIVFATSGFELGIDARRIENLDRFLGRIVPTPMRDAPFDLAAGWDWAVRMLDEGAFAAAVTTFAISIVAIVIAMAIALVFTLPAARNFTHPEPFLPGPRPPTRSKVFAWRALVWISRSVLLVLRAIPEYVWAFLFLAMLTSSVWPAILALALHNAGILGRLTSEVVENVNPDTPAALRGLGAGRRQIAAVALAPQSFTRFLLYFFYRWETCIREATVLGMLGIASLGFMIDDARNFGWYDEMLFLILTGGSLVIAVDLLSMVARRMVRNA